MTNFEQWQAFAQQLQNRADRVSQMMIERARKACKEAGLDPSLLGIHPHNAMCGLESGRPWPGVNYSLVRKSLWLQRKAWEPSRLASVVIKRAWDQMMREERAK